MHYDASVESVAEMTLVTVRVRNEAPVARRVRVRNLLDAPVCPPRREGVPEAGWDDEGYEGVVPAEGTVAVGYACPVASDGRDDSDPVAVESLGRTDDADDADGSDESGTVADAVRSLGRARPPADAVPDPVEAVRGDFDTRGVGRRGSDSTDGSSLDSASAAADPRDSPGGDAASPPDDAAADSPDAFGPPPTDTSPCDLPDSVASWLAEVRTRVTRAERLTDASAADAAAVLEETGGYGGVSSLPAAVAADEETLRTFAARADRLADRAAAADAEPVVESVGRLA